MKVLPEIVVDQTHSAIRITENDMNDSLPYVQSTKFDYIDM